MIAFRLSQWKQIRSRHWKNRLCEVYLWTTLSIPGQHTLSSKGQSSLSSQKKTIPKYFFLWISIKDTHSTSIKIPSTPYTTRVNKQKNRPWKDSLVIFSRSVTIVLFYSFRIRQFTSWKIICFALGHSNKPCSTWHGLYTNQKGFPMDFGTISN